jgi:4,5:9,10-diseco-3-hydroxy-5,9,17-trioxoandrosta-1(10),2-diene-4-oate hydrolase
MSEITNKTYKVAEGYEINIASVGAGEAVVCIHGSGPGASGLSNFRGNYAALNEAGYSVILPDLIGYGASSKPEGVDYSLDLFESTLYEALQAHGVKKAAFVGNSLGGAVAMQMALNHPQFVSSLILLAPGGMEEATVYMGMPGIQKMASVFMSPDYSLEGQKEILQHLVHPDFAPNIPMSLVQERFEVGKTQPKDVLFRMRVPNLTPRLSELTLPILVFWGKDDQFLPARSGNHFLEACPKARVVTFTRTGHWVQVERQAEFNGYTTAFLKASA